MVVDVDPEFDFLQFGSGRLLVFLLFRDVVTEFSEIDDLADRGVGGRGHFHQVETHALGPLNGLG